MSLRDLRYPFPPETGRRTAFRRFHTVFLLHSALVLALACAPSGLAAYTLNCGAHFEYEFVKVSDPGQGDCCFELRFTSMPDDASGYILAGVDFKPKAPVSLASAEPNSGYDMSFSADSMSWSNAELQENLPEVGTVCLHSSQDYIDATVRFWVYGPGLGTIYICEQSIELCCTCPTDPNASCRAERLDLTTGTADWEVVTWLGRPLLDNSYPAYVIDKHASWTDPQPGSQWISSYFTAECDIEGISEIERCFCVEEATEVRLYMEARAERSAVIVMNGISMGSTVQSASQSSPDIIDGSLFLQPGEYCVRVTLLNYQTGLLGFNAYGFLENLGPGYLMTDECCEQTSPSDDPPGGEGGEKRGNTEKADVPENNILGSLNAFPNPSTGVTTISFRLEAAGNVDLGLYTATGKRIRSLANDRHTSGSHSLDINTSGIAPGMYFVRLSTAEGRSQTIPLAVGP